MTGSIVKNDASVDLIPSYRLSDAAGYCDGLAGRGPVPDGLGPELEPDGLEFERFRSFRLRFCASSCLFFFFTEGFS
jgi:hypothetical protein